MRLEQVVTNLIGNAVKYGAGGAVEITLAATPSGASLAVRDHGIGIPPEEQIHLFERSTRFVSESHFGGFGLGLWIVKQIVQAFGGTISVTSEVGVGSTFVVELPHSVAATLGGDDGRQVQWRGNRRSVAEAPRH